MNDQVLKVVLFWTDSDKEPNENSRPKETEKSLLDEIKVASGGM